jgi:signal transduction histidine kinase
MQSAAEVALRNPREPEQYRRVLEDVLEEVGYLTRLSERLLFLCRGDAGLLRPERRPVALDGVVRDVVEHMRVVAGERGLTLDPGDLGPCPVRGDEGLLRRLLFNLLDNAIKYTPAGGSVTVRGECSGGRVRVVVADTGVGISAEHLPHVFERFYRADPARGRETEGTGLGLAISRAIVHSHGGDLRVESAPGRGTSVTLLLPADAPAPGAGDEALHRGVTAGATRSDRNGESHDDHEG